MVAIGVHVYGGDPNSASVIGQYGNPFLDYVAAFDLRAKNVDAPTVPFPSTGALCHYYTIPTSKTPNVIKAPVDLSTGRFSHFSPQKGFTQAGGFSQTGFQPQVQPQVQAQLSTAWNPNAHTSKRSLTVPNGNSVDEEGFLDIFQTAIKIGGPILGMVGGPIGAVASVALSAAGNIASSLGAEGAIEGDVPSSVPDGTVERAVVAEAALRALLDMDQQTLEEEGFIDVMKDVVGKIAPAVRKAAPKVLEAVGPAALKLAVDALKEKNAHGAESTFSRPTPVKIGRPIVRLTQLPTSGAEAFVARLNAAAEADEEGFLDSIGDFASSAGSLFMKGIKTAGPLLLTAAKTGLPLILDSMAESAIVGAPEPATMQAMDGVWQRAVVAEAALQAVLQAPQDVLEEEGFFGDLVKHIGKVAPMVIKHAPGVISAVAPVVKSVLGGGQESALHIERPRTPFAPLRKARSNTSLRRSAGVGATGGIWGHAKGLHDGIGLAH
jgi:hypothetical protein